ncbi:glycosyltransferase [Leisingera thetidis]|uniref:glycosyltransferase n=1 Tax=Leisingera thetidis TaxID=2930199 RepID=UPI0021F78AD0|nr:glycosyltransferase [Leisingera thetidis]
MHIVHILTRLLRAGSEENTIATCLWQARRGHRVTVVHGPDPDPYWQDRFGSLIDFAELPGLLHPIKPLQDFRAVRQMRNLLSGLQPDVIHTHQSKAGIIGRLAAAATPEALVVHGIHIIPFDGVSPLKRALYIASEKIAARRTDLFLAVSRSVGQAYVEAGICGSAEAVYSGMDLSPFRDPDLPQDWPALLGTAAGTRTRPPVVLMLAAFEPRKRHEAFLHAFAKVRADIPDTRILFAGKGPHEAAVRAAAAGLGLEKNVVFCGFRTDPEALIALADLCVLTSEREGLPRVVVQYIAAGRPVIVADLPGIEEIVADGVNGLVSDPDVMEDTAAKLRDLLLDRAALQHLAQGARATDVSDWELDRLGARTTEHYYRAMAAKHASVPDAEAAR